MFQDPEVPSFMSEFQKIIVALEKTWHQEHFTCSDCNVQLTGLSFFEKESLAYCQNCHMQKFAPKCKGCNKPITDTAIMALGEKWHQNCFQCSVSAPDSTFIICQWADPIMYVHLTVSDMQAPRDRNDFRSRWESPPVLHLLQTKKVMRLWLF